MELAAWSFAYAALWSDRQLSWGEIDAGQFLVNMQLAGKARSKMHFVDFCERIMLAHLQKNRQPAEYFPLPSIWLHPDYTGGYMATWPVYKEITSTRKFVTGYREGMTLLANYYWNRTSDSPTASFRCLRNRLLRLQETDLLNLCHTVMAYHHLLHHSVLPAIN